MRSSLTSFVAAVAMATASAIPLDDLGLEQLQQGQGRKLSASDTGAPPQKQSDDLTCSKHQSTHVQYQIRNGTIPCKGVNLGGWLVGEKWMTDSNVMWTGTNLSGAGEYTAIANASNPDLIRSYFERHHATFITEQDIADIAAAGLNMVRVSIGHWAIKTDVKKGARANDWKVYTRDILFCLDQLIVNWAKKYNIAVLLDMHAARGSQNGHDHSSPPVPGVDLWATDPFNVDDTIQVVTILADRYKCEEAFLGIDLLNEPNGTTTTTVLYNYYQRAYNAIRGQNNDCVLVVSPLLTQQKPEVVYDFMRLSFDERVWVTMHPYFSWGYDDVSPEDLVEISVKVDFQARVTQWNSVPGRLRLFHGEWSFATINKFPTRSELFYEFARAQYKVIIQAEAGYSFWSHKLAPVNGNDMWSLQEVLRDPKLKAILSESAPSKSL